jgi:recombination protein RecT
MSEKNAVEAKRPSKLDGIMGTIIERKSSLKRLLPRTVDMEWFLAEVRVSFARNPDLLKCAESPHGQASIFDAVTACAQLGLSPSGRLGSAHLIPFNTSVKVGEKWTKVHLCQLVVGYRGYLDLVRRTGEVTTLHAEVVYEGEPFMHREGLAPDIQHEPKRDEEPGALRAVYAYAVMKDGFKQHVVMYRPDIARVRASARGADNDKSPWKTAESEMWKKSAVRRLVKMLPLSPEKARAVTRAHEAEDAKWESTHEVSAEEAKPAPTRTAGLKARLVMEGGEYRITAGAPRETLEAAPEKAQLPISHPDAEPPDAVFNLQTGEEG